MISPARVDPFADGKVSSHVYASLLGYFVWKARNKWRESGKKFLKIIELWTPEILAFLAIIKLDLIGQLGHFVMFLKPESH